MKLGMTDYHLGESVSTGFVTSNLYHKTHFCLYIHTFLLLQQYWVYKYKTKIDHCDERSVIRLDDVITNDKLVLLKFSMEENAFSFDRKLVPNLKMTSQSMPDCTFCSSHFLETDGRNVIKISFGISTRPFNEKFDNDLS